MPTTTTTRPRVTILGSGVTGLTCALDLSRDYDVTIVARNMPGDPPSLAWASPWAGAIFLGVDGCTPEQAKMQADSFERLWQLAEESPESSVRRMSVYDYQDMHESCKDMWYNFMPNWRELNGKELQAASARGSGMFYTSIVITPDVYLPWLRGKLEAAGVKFVRAEVASLKEAANLAPGELVVNATGNGAKFLMDVADQDCVQVRGQTMLVRCAAPDIHIRHALRWDEYTYVLPRGDGTAIMGGIKEFGSIDPIVNEELKRKIHERCHEMLPQYVPERFEDLDIVRDLVGVRPERKGGVRVEADSIGGVKVVHAYGLTGGGYVYSYGISKAVKKLVDGELAGGVVARL